ncbi:hypothetical protein L5515_015332 [Caenorhabditis briggsae]|uniref:Uncharacterized protein n=1 Tax=Caenorhabditis briggsae TaxID=6238 RepID=A0AAE9EBK7_CAEBR|nr:hypothetical protein L5515_015332 [Caenorhabditis briggsae]
MDDILLEEEHVIVDTVPDQLMEISAKISRMESAVERVDQAIKQLEAQLKKQSEPGDDTKKRKFFCAKSLGTKPSSAAKEPQHRKYSLQWRASAA